MAGMLFTTSQGQSHLEMFFCGWAHFRIPNAGGKLEDFIVKRKGGLARERENVLFGTRKGIGSHVTEDKDVRHIKKMAVTNEFVLATDCLKALTLKAWATCKFFLRGVTSGKCGCAGEVV